ncbi:hypothetical protein DUI87_07378 [Hirundo rustica rustica]|uniref:Uncharacterized protein n=1 Tax=Hirundo rustica rustica TaxID=333673 RepID=A0A3M0KQ29_HIRRU|nr:hypothetical protein DUI87_07378 [Hirundo rustica rustica]
MSFLCWEPRAGAERQVGSHKSREEGQNPVPWPTAHTALDAAEDTFAFLDYLLVVRETREIGAKSLVSIINGLTASVDKWNVLSFLDVLEGLRDITEEENKILSGQALILSTMEQLEETMISSQWAGPSEVLETPKKAGHHLVTPSFQGVVEGKKVISESPILETKDAHLPQLVLMRFVLQILHQLSGCPSLDTLQHPNVLLVVRGPKLKTGFEVQPVPVLSTVG